MKEVCDIVSRYLIDEEDLNVENIELKECCNVIELHADMVVDNQMFDVEPETKLNDSQLRRLHMAMKDCHSLDIEFRMIAAVEKFLRVYNLAPGHWESVINGIKSLNGTSDDAAIFMAGYMAKVFIDEIEYQYSGEKLT